MEIRRIQTPPVNMKQFVDEMLPEYGRIYGKGAAMAYRLAAPTQLAATIAHPSIRAYALLEDNHARALLFLQTTDLRHTLSFFHVLKGHDSINFAPALLQSMLSDIPKEDARLIISEYLALGELDLAASYRLCGFQEIKRQIMRKPCTEVVVSIPEHHDVRSAKIEETSALASVLYTAYRGHPEQFLYEEVQSESAARAFLRRCFAGAFGNCPPDYSIGAWHGSTCVGLIVGTEVVAEMGFVLHMAVLPSHRGQGIGSALMNALNTRFLEHNITFVALGVTCDNGAVRLYKKLNFETLHPFTVYYRPGSSV